MSTPAETGAQIFIVEDSRLIADILRQLLTEAGYQVQVANNAEAAYELVTRQPPDIILTDVTLPGMDGYQLCRKLRQHPQTRLLPILMLTSHGDVADKISGFEAGANDYVTKPFQPEEVVYRVKGLLSRVHSPSQNLVGHARGRTLAVFGGKGGVGKTTLAVNLALALLMRSKKSVLIADMDFAFGDVGVQLNLPSVRSVGDLIKYSDELDGELIQQVVTQHASGLRVLLNPPTPAQAELISAAQVGRLLDLLPDIYDYVVVDCQPSCYDERMLTILDHADDILLVVTPEIGPVKNTSHFLHLSRQLEIAQEKIHLVLNRANSEVGIAAKEIERTLQQSIRFPLVSGGRAVVQSVNQGVPLVAAQPKHPLSQQIWQMAGHFS